MCRAVDLKQISRQHRRKRDSCSGRYADHDGNNPTELAEEDTRHTRNHRKWQEHSNDNKRSGNNREPHLVGSVDSCLLRLRASLDMRSDVLEYHDGIVNDHTDGERECRERYDVERRARSKEVDEGTYQRDWDGQAYDKRRTPTAQEEHNHEDYEDKGEHNGLGERVDRIVNLARGLEDGLHLTVFWQRRYDFVEALLHLLDDSYSVGTRLLLNHHTHTAASIDTLIHRSLLEGIDDCSDIREHNCAAATIRYYDVVQLTRVVELEVRLDVKHLVTEVEPAGTLIFSEAIS